MPFGLHIPAMYGDYERRRRLGSFMLAMDPNRFAGGATLAATAAQMAAEARRQPTFCDGAEILVPSDPEYRCEKIRRRDGIPIEPGLWKEFCEWSARMKVEPPRGPTRSRQGNGQFRRRMHRR
jgi:ureidoglycolate dehydrogenase (NAD+)